jgi:hypothetical protein
MSYTEVRDIDNLEPVQKMFRGGKDVPTRVRSFAGRRHFGRTLPPENEFF